jgi:predicted Zn-dependent protease
VTSDRARTRFHHLVDVACADLRQSEVLLANVAGEDSDFVRFNHAAVRQAGSVRQCTLSLDLIEGSRHARGSISVTDSPEVDRGRVAQLVAELRATREGLAEDPYLLYSTEARSSDRAVKGSLPDPGHAIDGIVSGAAGRDLVGIYAAGDTYRGFASSLGHRNWFVSSTFNLDWSQHLDADKATKGLYAGAEWDEAVLATKLARSIGELDVVGRPSISLSPGRYRVYLAPAAVREILEMTAWDGFGLRAHRTTRTPLLRMVTDGARLHDAIRISEDIAGGVSPDFQRSGFSRPDEIVLIDNGELADHLVSPRSAMEFGVSTNGAENDESPVSLSMAPGDLPTDGALGALGTGIFVGNLWYLNFSDRAAGRLTGMTRFATFWVEDGEIVAPINVLRFDDSVFDLLGERLECLGADAETMPDSSTYDRRSTVSWRVPGALVSEMAFTL